ncbi:protein kinase [Nocardioides dongxiaopingii]|uniref:serine/threonine-protein kinase n=1 Tax=Nocardioides sp. S-1144 TaxID=2582905 RepID=UPI0011656384|nr:serine/threonine-protein kinase [Nocardioides sp. S-1144]QCW49966.2 protein kinase [Nocardioides sp. S-1144]
MVSGGMGTSDGSDAAWRPPAAGPATVEELDGYTDLTEVGRGGDSVVYRARQESVGRDVAIKVLSIDTTSDPARSVRFKREIDITVQLGRQHPNIVTVLAVGTTASGKPAVVMDFFEGGTLHDRLKAHGPLPPEEVGRIGEVLADALSFAHERGVLHRDVKPQNVLVLPTSWVLADFGIARLVDSEHTSSAETFTYRHAAPQILDGHPPTPLDDVWSLGSTLYTLLDGRPPFASDDPDEDSALAYLRRARTEPHRPLQVPGAERLAPIIDRCLSKDVAGRWGSAAALHDALHALRGSAWEPAGPTTPPLLAKAAPPRTAGDAAESPTPTPTPTLHASAPAPISPAPISPAPLSPSPARGAEPAEPSPVAISAVSHVVRVADAAPTGTGFPDTTGAAPGPSEPTPEAPEEEKAPRRRLPIVLGVAALVIGLLLGLLGAVLRGRDDDETPVRAAVTPDGSAVAPPSVGGTVTSRPDTDLAVVLQSLEYDGVTLRATWTDPADGEGSFALLATDPSFPNGRVIATFPAGQTSGEAAVRGLPPGRTCFFMGVFLVDGTYGLNNRQSRCEEVVAGGGFAS